MSTSLLSDPQRLAALHRPGVLGTAPEPASDGIVRLAAHICAVPMSAIASWTATASGSRRSSASPWRRRRPAPHSARGVRDTGVGMSEQECQNVFEPFVRGATHEVRNEEGTGLGLPITKRLVELHGGTIAIASARGVGTTVTVRLPAVRAAGSMPHRRRSARSPDCSK